MFQSEPRSRGEEQLAASLDWRRHKLLHFTDRSTELSDDADRVEYERLLATIHSCTREVDDIWQKQQQEIL